MTSQAHTAYPLNAVLSPRARDTLKHLELFARKTVEGMLHGMHRSKRKGVSTEFDHHNMYQPGDPLKHIDWKVSARSDNYYVKRYLEDTALSVRLVVDRSGSMAMATGEEPSKYLQAARLAACLAYLILNQKDGVGMVLTSEDRMAWLPVRSTEMHLVRMLQALALEAPAAEDSLARSLKTLLERAERKGLVVVISDLMFDPEPVMQQMSRLCAQGHEVLLCQLRDPTEEEFPFNRWVLFQDLEVPSRRHRIDAVPLKKIYREEYQALMDEYRAWAKKYDVHYMTWRTDTHVETVLSDYIAYRAEIAGLR